MVSVSLHAAKIILTHIIVNALKRKSARNRRLRISSTVSEKMMAHNFLQSFLHSFDGYPSWQLKYKRSIKSG